MGGGGNFHLPFLLKAPGKYFGSWFCFQTLKAPDWTHGWAQTRAIYELSSVETTVDQFWETGWMSQKWGMGADMKGDWLRLLQTEEEIEILSKQWKFVTEQKEENGAHLQREDAERQTMSLMILGDFLVHPQLKSMFVLFIR